MQVLKNHTTTLSSTDHRKDLPSFIRSHISLKRQIRAQWQRTHDFDIKSSLNRQTSLVRDLLHSYRNDEWTNFLSSFENDPPGWNRIYKLNRRLLHKHPASQPLFDDNGTRHYESQEKSEIFAKSMEAQFQIPSNHSSESDKSIQETVARLDGSSYPKMIFFSPIEISNAIKRLHNNKSPAPTESPTVHLNTPVLKHSYKSVKFLTAVSVSNIFPTLENTHISLRYRNQKRTLYCLIITDPFRY